MASPLGKNMSSRHVALCKGVIRHQINQELGRTVYMGTTVGVCGGGGYVGESLVKETTQCCPGRAILIPRKLELLLYLGIPNGIRVALAVEKRAAW